MSNSEVALPRRALHLLPTPPLPTRKRREVRTAGLVTIPHPEGTIYVEAIFETVVHPDDSWELTIQRARCPHALVFRGDRGSPTPAFLRDVLSSLEADC